MALKDIAFEDDYRSAPGKLVNEFFRPALGQSKIYWRAVGYFSSSALERFGAPLGEFLRHGGTIRLITSVELRPQDLDVIAKGRPKLEVCAERLAEIIESEFGDTVGPGVERLARLLELGRLEIQIATPRHGTGIYHEKIGLFFDGHDYVAFTGSANESEHAFEQNSECVDVYPSWSDARRAQRKHDHFDTLWRRLDDNVDVYSFPEAARLKLIRRVEEHRAGRPAKAPETPTAAKWRHQDDALNWFLEKERGILNMATGTGKTRTALKIVSRLVQDGQIDTVIVTTDGNDLLRQWRSELLQLRSDIGFQLFSDIEGHRDLQNFTLSPTGSIFLVTRTSNSDREPLARALKSLSSAQGQRTLLIHDEVHKLGSHSNRQKLAGLSDNIRFRLGLSATPDREYDTDGNAFIAHHIGAPKFEFTLEDAISRGILAPFHYFPLDYELTVGDRQRLKDVHGRKAARAHQGMPMSDEEFWTALALVYKTAEGKLPVFREFIARRPDLLERCIVFVETREYAKEVLEIVHRHRSDFHTYFGGEDAETLKRFARGELQCLITCHRVSEGIDIQSLTSVILFSSAKARLETIQRMGRCLRSDPANPEKMANVVDFTRSTDSDNPEGDTDTQRREWLTRLSEIRFEETA